MSVAINTASLYGTTREPPFFLPSRSCTDDSLEQVRGVSTFFGQRSLPRAESGERVAHSSPTILASKPVRPMPDRVADDDAMDVSFSIAISQRNPDPCPS